MEKLKELDKLQQFVVWLDGFLDASEAELNISRTNAIRNKLNDLFEHEAEPPQGVSLQELGEQHNFIVHDGFPNKNGFGRSDEKGVIYRC